MYFRTTDFVQSNMPGVQATERRKIKDFVSALEKGTLQWARSLGKTLKGSKRLHLGNWDMSLDILFVCFKTGFIYKLGCPKVLRMAANSQRSA